MLTYLAGDSIEVQVHGGGLATIVIIAITFAVVLGLAATK